MWYSSTNVGILEIDMDHNNIDTMLQLYFSGRVPEAFLENIIDGLLRHFVHEERVIIELGREFPSVHKAEHERLSEILEKKVAEWKAKKLDGKVLAEEVRNLLLIHVVDFDVKLGS